ncbi:MAG: glycosyl hydrolase, partial [Calditrichaeota bacterium]
LREIYMPGFKAAVQQGGVLSVMCSYNKFRGEYLCSNAYLLTDVLKEEWDFPGVVLSDWDATHSTIPAAKAGLDLEMGTNVSDYKDYYFADPLIDAVRSGKLDKKVVDDKVRRILGVMFAINMFGERSNGSLNTPEHQQFALKVAEEAVVLLKNENNLLPLDISSVKSVAVIGDNATREHAPGGYSSGIKALYEVTPLEGLQNKLKDKVKINFALGYEKTSQEIFGKGVVYSPNPERATQLIEEAVAAAEQSDVAIIFGGLNHDFDTEGLDRTDMKLPYTQNELIKAVHQANPSTIVVLISGSPVEIYEWADLVPSILQGWYAGMEGGNAFANILFGDVNPSGKLPFTMPVKLEDSPAHAIGEYPGTGGTVNYNEGILVGYRYFLTRNIEPQFCFGHGLSYTQFAYSDLKIKESVKEVDLPLEVGLKVTNTGDRPGMEVVQLYVGDKQATVERPDRELKGFRKVYLSAGEEKEIKFTLDRDALSFYDSESSSWKAEPGIFTILLGSSSQDIRLMGEFNYSDK